MSVTLVHLSDIHFQVKKAIYDLDRDLRNELERDCVDMRRRLPAPASILITGDIAFKGAQDEYDVAWAWISDRLCKMVETPTEKVRCIPGNHDVDRGCIDRSKSIRDCYRNLREVPVEGLYREFQEYEQEPRVFYEKLEAYNRFALRFGCDVSDAKPYWESDFQLGGSTNLRVRGLNSTLVSDRNDDNGANKLILGEHQFTVPRMDGVIYMVLSHHPPQWLRDEDSVKRQDVRNYAATLLRGLLESGMIGRRSIVDVVFNKWDLVESDPNKERTVAFVESIAEQFKAKFGNAFGDLTFRRVAARPKEGDLHAGYGVGELFASWLNDSRLTEPTRTADLSEPLNSEFDKFADRSTGLQTREPTERI